MLTPSVQQLDGDYLRRLAAVGLMTPSVVHDVNNLLQSVASVLRMMERKIDQGASDEMARLAADGLHAIDRASKLSKRLMTYGRPNPPMLSHVDIRALLCNMAPLLRWSLGFETRLEFALGDDPLVTWCDPQDLENAVMNLTINARDAMPEGGTLMVQLYRAELLRDHPTLPGGSYVNIAVCDTGHGMEPSVASRAFDPFFTTKSGGAGFGLGLASVKAFVDAVGGGAEITSEVGHGTIVRLYLLEAKTAACC